MDSHGGVKGQEKGLDQRRNLRGFGQIDDDEATTVTIRLREVSGFRLNFFQDSLNSLSGRAVSNIGIEWFKGHGEVQDNSHRTFSLCVHICARTLSSEP